MAAGKMYQASLPFSATYKKGRKNKKSKKAKSKVGRLQQQIKAINDRIPVPQLKAVDINSYSTAVSDIAGANHPMIQIAQGNTAAQRNGDAAVLRSSQLNLTCVKGDTTNVLRIILAATPSTSNLVLSDVLQYSNLTSHGMLPFSSPYKFQPTSAEKTYTILFDKVYNLTDDVDTIVDKVKIQYGKKGKRVQFNSASSVMPENYNVSLMYISDSSASGHPAISYNFRTRFQDA
jgi:hypothetical protein